MMLMLQVSNAKEQLRAANSGEPMAKMDNYQVVGSNEKAFIGSSFADDDLFRAVDSQFRW